MATRQCIWGLAVALGCVALGLVLGPKPLPAYNPVASPAPPGGDSPMTTVVVKGAGSCSGRGCHGDPRPVREEGAAGRETVRQNEYVVWVTRDRHANAYQVLFNDRSKQIARCLNDTKNGQVVEAHENERCLACHATPQAVGHAADTAHLMYQDGVGCESCHGAAGKWLGPHVSKEWHDWGNGKQGLEKKAALGFIPLTDLAIRAQTCAGCHVGAPEKKGELPLRDMNHDLVAAGHPRLNFEFSAFQANMPHHWRAKDQPAAEWLLGEAAVAKTALELLADRADRAGKEKAPWPEFAEYDCFACHHDLRGKSWRQERGYGERMPGSLPWGTWYYSMPRMLAGPNFANTPDVLSSLNQLEQLMQRPYPAQEAVVKEARQAATRMGELLGKLEKASYEAKAVAKDYANELNGKRAATRADWDAVGQLYLALAALNQAKPDKETEALLKELSQRLTFPTNDEAKHRYDSPKDKEYPAKPLSDILKPLNP